MTSPETGPPATTETARDPAGPASPRWLAWASPTRVIAAAVAVLALVVTALVLTADDGASKEPMVGRPAPPLSGKTLDGGRTTVRYPPGTTTVVNVWASWCGPCREELPLIGELARRPPVPGIRVRTLNTRDGEVPARELLAELGLRDLPTILDPQGTTAVAWGVRGIPETFVVDDRGRIVARRVGVIDERWVAEVLVPEARR
jgi:cytochrome c biogenesis protein CcmG/thiol:disulfide interchange protein DsbE